MTRSSSAGVLGLCGLLVGISTPAVALEAPTWSELEVLRLEAEAAALASAASPRDSTMQAAAPDSAKPTPPILEQRRKLGITGRAKRAVTNVLSDGWYIVSSPFDAKPTTWLWFGALLGAEVILYTNDEAIYAATLRNESDPTYDRILSFGEHIEPVGFMRRNYPYYLGILAVGYVFDIDKMRSFSIEIMESHLIAGGMRNIGKYFVGRDHPYEHNGSHRFKLGHGTSFPSGHTSVAFELATVTSMNVDRWPVTVLAYGAATTVAMQRVHSGNHWASDVLIAAVYGTMVSRTIVRLHEERLSGRKDDPKMGVMLAPAFSEQGRLVGASVMRRF